MYINCHVGLTQACCPELEENKHLDFLNKSWLEGKNCDFHSVPCIFPPSSLVRSQ